MDLGRNPAPAELKRIPEAARTASWLLLRIVAQIRPPNHHLAIPLIKPGLRQPLLRDLQRGGRITAPVRLCRSLCQSSQRLLQFPAASCWSAIDHARRGRELDDGDLPVAKAATGEHLGELLDELAASVCSRE